MSGTSAQPSETGLREYQFAPLKKGKYIRVLHLRDATDQSQALIGTLQQIDLGDKTVPSYEALSWCWGGQKSDEILRIEDKQRTYHLKITKNLASALKSLRRRNAWRTLWIDAICINQQEVSERNHQVSMMNLVYGRTSNVCVWLDDNRPHGKNRHFDAGTAFKFIRDQVLDLWHFDEVCKEEVNSPNWVALVHLMTKPWFSRRWVIQEIALAPRATIHCGDHEMKWADFADAVSLFVEAESATHRLSEIVKGDKRFHHVQGLFADVHTMGATMLVQMTSNLFRLTQEGKRKPLSTLEHLVSSLSMFDSSEIRDTIYALLAISKDTAPDGGGDQGKDLKIRHEPALRKFLAEHKHLKDESPERQQKVIEAASRVAGKLAGRLRFKAYEVAYEKPVLDVYKQFVEFCIRQSNSLDILCRPWAPQPQSAKLDRLNVTNAPRLLGPAGTSTEVNGSSTRRESSHSMNWPLMPSWIADKKETAFVLSSHDVTRVKMERRNADPLVGLPERRIYHASGDLGVRRTVPRFVRWNEHQQSLFVEGFVVDKVEKTTLPAVLGNIPREWLDLTTWKNELDEGAPADFCRTLVADRGPNGLNPPPFYERACTEAMRLMLDLDGLDTLRAINEKQCTIVAQFLRRVREVVFNRKLIKTRGGAGKDDPLRAGSLGIAPRQAKPGDLVCILYGCSVPVVLRKKEKSSEDIKEEEDIMSKQYPQRLFQAVRVIQKRLLFWRNMKNAIEEWEKENPEKAKERAERTGKSYCERCKTKVRRSDTTFTFHSTVSQVNDTNADYGDSEDGSKALSELEEPPNHDLDPSMRGIGQTRAQTWPVSSNETFHHESKAGEGHANGKVGSHRKATGEPSGEKSDGEETPEKDTVSWYNKMCEQWARMIASGEDYPFKNVGVEDKKIEVPKLRENQKYYYTVIGECYVDEMMSGEALGIRADEGIKDTVFELR